MRQMTAPNESQWKRASMRLRRARVHLARPRGRWAFTFAAMAGLVAWRVGVSSNIGQIAIVVLGICISVWLLPEEPHRIWKVEVKDLAETVPADHLRDTLIKVADARVVQFRSKVPLNDLSALWRHAIHDLDVVCCDASRIVRDLTYEISLTPQSVGPPKVETTIAATRCIPDAGDFVWFSFCSSQDALEHEFGLQPEGCIAREIVDPTPEESGDLSLWKQRVEGENYSVSLRVDGSTVESSSQGWKQDSTNGRDWAVFRTYFPSESLREVPVKTRLSIHFFAEPGQHRFPVKFTSYWVLGATTVEFKVSSPGALLEMDEYFSAMGRSVDSQFRRTGSGSVYVISTSEDSVLAPGSGAVFTWVNPPDRAA